MKDKYINIICCPLCHGNLILEKKVQENNEIKTGNLVCAGCKNVYRIENYIPVLLNEGEGGAK